MTDDYQAQRIRGSIEIIDFAKTIALNNQIDVGRFEWDNGRDIVDRDVHIFRVYVDGEARDVEIGDAALADYPGQVGTEETDRRVRELILSFKKTDEIQSADNSTSEQVED